MAGPRTSRLGALSATRFGRRIFLVFVVSALVPIAALSALSSFRVTQELREQSARRLHAASRTVGMAVMEQLIGVQTALASSGPALDGAHPLGRQIAGLAAADGAGGWHALFGAPVPEPVLGNEELAILRGGGSLLRSPLGAEPRCPLLLVGRPDGTWLAACLRLEILFDAAAEDSLPPEAEFCVFDANGTPLRCSLSGQPRLPTVPEERNGLTAQAWSHAGTDYLAAPWPLFLKASFHHPGWTVLVAEPASVVYAPIASFRTHIILVTVLALLLVSLLSIQQIRLRLVPLEHLRAGTRRIAESDFAARVDVESSDEFGELASSFNSMAERLDAQFQSLERVIEIDRHILAARDEEGLAAAFLEPLERVHPCRFALVVVRGEEDDAPLRVHLRVDGESTSIREAPPSLDPSFWRDLPPSQRVAGPELPAFCRSLIPRDAAEFVIIPLTSGREHLGVFIAGHDEADVERERILYLKQLCDQLAAALYGTRLRVQNERLQRYDPLTGLPNARWLEEQVGRAIASAGPGFAVGLGRIGIEGLDRVRSTFGPEEVDRILRSVADRLRQQEGLGAAHLLAGEFGILIQGGDAEAAARQLRTAFLAVKDLAAEDERAYLLRIRAGVAVAPLDGREAAGLLRNCEAALRHAREREGAELTFYAGPMNRALEARVRLESDLARAVEREELRLFYQPIVDSATRRIVAAEALVRWQHETGLRTPGEFIPLAEEIGLIGAIGSWVLRTACYQIRSWQDAGLPAVRVSVNVSAHQLRRATLLAEVTRALSAARIGPELLGLELTESALMGDELGLVETLHAIHRCGVSLSLDDFGTGYSSLAYLKRFPLDALKLDRVFVQGVTREPDKRAITEAVLTMAGGLGLRVIAEGVETEEQLGFLRERGCPLVQGFLFGAPMAEDAFRKLLGEGRTAPGAPRRYTPPR